MPIDTLPPTFPEPTVTASLMVREHGQEPIEADISVLRWQPGDTLVLKCRGRLTLDQSNKMRALIEERFHGLTAIVLDDAITLEGVLRRSR